MSDLDNNSGVSGRALLEKLRDREYREAFAEEPK